jgi:hypothetical protein
MQWPQVEVKAVNPTKVEEEVEVQVPTKVEEEVEVWVPTKVEEEVEASVSTKVEEVVKVEAATKAKIKAKAAAATRTRCKEKPQSWEQVLGYQHRLLEIVVVKGKELAMEVYLAQSGEVSRHREECGKIRRRFFFLPHVHLCQTYHGI